MLEAGPKRVGSDRISIGVMAWVVAWTRRNRLMNIAITVWRHAQPSSGWSCIMVGANTSRVWYSTSRMGSILLCPADPRPEGKLLYLRIRVSTLFNPYVTGGMFERLKECHISLSPRVHPSPLPSWPDQRLAGLTTKTALLPQSRPLLWPHTSRSGRMTSFPRGTMAAR